MPKCWTLLDFGSASTACSFDCERRGSFATPRSGTNPAVVVVRETQHREETRDALRRWPPVQPRQFPDPDQAAGVLLAAGGPVDITHHELVLRADASAPDTAPRRGHIDDSHRVVVRAPPHPFLSQSHYTNYERDVRYIPTTKNTLSPPPRTATTHPTI